ncbi:MULTISPECIES: hypothetical protein [unclassified Cyanobium]|uniref:hypothetical protein n=1 Tax=unclassified Cyanobium TaxID=2627006 RepID=UPI0020CFDEF5|nr:MULTISPECIES: hypothetical protein [unclassified Cyanobium]MCP9834175.1 hypothetical protein [Cyanobium sp. La Preciosa 7G6]MCP9936938.1 hypothetical protein [Cyanobium sp. Aljojuca 7A6]
MMLPDGIGAAWMLQKGPTLLQMAYLARSKESLGKKQALRLPLAMGENLCAG